MKIKLIKLKNFTKLLTLWKEAGSSVANFEREQKELLMLLKFNPDSCLVATVNSKIVGSIIGAFNGRRAWIYHLAIHPKWQKKGIGSKLLKTVEKILKNKGVTKILLGVSLNNLSTCSFYEKSGYFIMNDAILMSKEL